MERNILPPFPYKNKNYIMNKEKFVWHLRNNVLPTLNENTIEQIWETIEQVNAGNKSLSDLLSDNVTSIGEMVEDLKLQDFIQ